MTIKDTMEGHRPISDLTFLKTLHNKDLLNIPVLNTEDAAR